MTTFIIIIVIIFIIAQIINKVSFNGKVDENSEHTISQNELIGNKVVTKATPEESLNDKVRSNPNCFYKIVEEHNGDNNESKQYTQEYIFNNGSLLKNKFDAADWLQRRAKVVENKKNLFLKSLENSDDEIEEIRFNVKMIFVEILPEGEHEYVLIDGTGKKNMVNVDYENFIIGSLGFTKADDINNNTFDGSRTKNSYLGY